MTGPALFDLTPPAAAKLARDDTVHALPPWVKRRLEAMGLMDPDTGATRRARARICSVCRQPVMRGYDRDTFGQMSVDCDPTPLSVEGELQALIAGRRTYDLRWQGAYYLYVREYWHIRDTPPGSRRIDVLVEHEHHSQPYSAISSNLMDSLNTAPLPDKPPF